MGVLDGNADSSTVVLGRHGTAVLGACAAPGGAAATVQGDGVHVHDRETQTRARSWAVGRGHGFAAPATYDAGSGMYFAAILPPGGREDPALVAWTKDDPAASLDAAVGGGSTRLPDGVAALVPVGEGDDREEGGGVLAVDGHGGVRWFGPDARKLAAAPGATGGADEKRRRVVEAASAASPTGGGGVLVVTSDAASGRGGTGGGGNRVAALYRAKGGEHSGRSVETVWEVVIEPGHGNDDGARVVAAAADDDHLCMFWSNDEWCAYDPKATPKHPEDKGLWDEPGVPTRKLQIAAGAGTPSMENLSLNKSGKGKRSGRETTNTSSTDALPAATLAAMGGGYFLLAIVGAPGSDGGARLAIVDAKYGAVQSVDDVGGGGGGGGGGGADDGVAAIVLPDDGDRASRTIITCHAGEVILSEMDTPPKLSLLAVMGKLCADERGEPARILLGKEGFKAANKPAQYGIYKPKMPTEDQIPRKKANEPLTFLGDPRESDWWNDGFEKSERMAIETIELFDGDAPLDEDAALKAIDPFLNGDEMFAPLALDAVIRGCVKNKLWELLRGVIGRGFVTGSAAAPQLVRAYIENDRALDLEKFYVQAIEYDPLDIRRALDAILPDCDGPSFSAEALAAVKARHVKIAKLAVRDAERAEKERRETKQKHGTYAEKEHRAKASLARARVCTASVEAFPETPYACALHFVVSYALDSVTAARTLLGLPMSAATKLVAYLSKWLAVYAGEGDDGPIDPEIDQLVAMPTMTSIVTWTNGIIDSHFSSLAMATSSKGGESDGGAESAEDAEVEALKKNAEKLQRACAAVGKMKGALQHVREGAPLPDDQGVKSTTYSIERIEDW